MFHLGLGIVQWRWNVFHTHVHKTGKAAEKLAAHGPQQRSHVLFSFILAKMNPQLVADPGQILIDVADHLGEDLVKRLENEFDEASMSGRMGRLSHETSGLRVEVNVAPKTLSELVDVKTLICIPIS